MEPIFPVTTFAAAVGLLVAINLYRRRGDDLTGAKPQQQDQQSQQDNTGNFHQKKRLTQRRAVARADHGPELWMAIAVTLGISAAALYIVLSKQYEQDALKWAYGALGTVLGYWLKR